MVATAKVFTSGNSQAVRLPKAFRVDAAEMWITRNMRTGEITLKPKPESDDLEAFLQELRSHLPSEEFVPPRHDAPRGDPLAGWAE
jgi:antitoxin VapB